MAQRIDCFILGFSLSSQKPAGALLAAKRGESRSGRRKALVSDRDIPRKGCVERNPAENEEDEKMGNNGRGQRD